MDKNHGYIRTTQAPDGVLEHHFAARPSLSMEQCRQGGLSCTDFERRQYAKPLVYNFDPSSDRYDRRTTTTPTRH